MVNRKLLIFSPSHAIHGGVETIVNDLCRELPKRGWKTMLALAKGSKYNDVKSYQVAYPDLPIIEVDGTKGTRQGRLESLTRLIDSIKPDIVLSARIFDAYEAVVRHKKQKNNITRLAVAIRGYEPPYFYDAALYKATIDLCIVDGNLIEAAAMMVAGLPKERILSIPGGIKPPIKNISPRKSRDFLRIGYVGRLTQNDKRILDSVPFIMGLLEEGIDFSFDFIGTGPEDASLRQKLAAAISNGVVTFAGWKEQRELYEDIYPRLDCIVNFSSTEGVTIAPREAMTHGVVPVISEFTGLRAEGQFLDEVNCLIFRVGDTEKAAVNIKRLVTEPGLMERLSTNAMNSQKGKYTFEGSMDAWAEALTRCLEMPPALGTLPKLQFPADGRLARMGIPPWLAQRVRDLLGRKHIHSDPGSEWPTCSGLMTAEGAQQIMSFASDYESGLNG